jgi:branched-subunit amino acid ABC-type transport system permease component
VFYPPIANTLIFIVMVLVMLFRPAGLFGTPERRMTALTRQAGAGRS